LLRTAVGKRQGDPIWPTTFTSFTSYLERGMDTIKDRGTGVSVNGHRINNLMFADDRPILIYWGGRQGGAGAARKFES